MPVTLNASTATGFITTSDTSGDVALQANGTTKLTVSSTGVNIGQYNPGTSLITSGTVQNSTSGTAINFTGIPSWVKRITVMLRGVSTSGTSNWLFQLGDSGGIENTGYVSTSTGFNGAAGSTAASTAGFILLSNDATYLTSGIVTFVLMGSNIWVAGGVGKIATTASFTCGGDKSLSDTLDRIRLTTVNGTDTFDAGSINILYE